MIAGRPAGRRGARGPTALAVFVALAAGLAGCVGAGSTPGAAMPGTSPSAGSSAAPTAPAGDGYGAPPSAVSGLVSPAGTVSAGSSPPAGGTASPSPPGGPTAAPTAGLVVITLADEGRTVSVPRGDRVLIDLGFGFTWSVTIADPRILSRVIGVMVIAGAQGLYDAARTGTTLVTAVGDPACRSATPPCMVPSRLFTTTVVVT